MQEEVKDYLQMKNHSREGVLALFRKVYGKLCHWELVSEKQRPGLLKALSLLLSPMLGGFLHYPA